MPELPRKVLTVADPAHRETAEAVSAQLGAEVRETAFDGSGLEQTGSETSRLAAAMRAIEDAATEVGAEAALLYGDDDLVLAAALVLVKLEVPLAWVDVSARTGKGLGPASNSDILAQLCDVRIDEENLSSMPGRVIASLSDRARDP